MSWSKHGVRVDQETNFEALREQWRGEVAAADVSSAPDADVIATGHAEQIDRAVEVIERLAGAFDPPRPLMVSAHGHASTDGSGSMGVSYTPTE